MDDPVQNELEQPRVKLATRHGGTVYLPATATAEEIEAAGYYAVTDTAETVIAEADTTSYNPESTEPEA